MNKLLKQPIEMLELIKNKLTSYDGNIDIDDLIKDIDSILKSLKSYPEKEGGRKAEKSYLIKLFALIRLFVDLDDLN